VHRPGATFSPQVADRVGEAIGRLKKKPAVIGHSFGGLLAQIIAGRGLSAATVAIDPAPFRGVLPLPISALESAWPVLGNPKNHGRAVPLTYEQFRFAFANAVSEDEAKDEMPNRGHALTVDSGWREVADKALGFVRRFV
jgi:pimeloyl-ACP methyl ester carboxylesterase